MDLKKAKKVIGSSVLEQEEYSVPLFKNHELETAESIVQALEGMPIDSAQELLKKVSKSLTQLVSV